MHDTDFDFSLDERQRNMLDAMGIRVWLPDAARMPEPKPVSAPTAQATAPASTSTPAPQDFKSNQPPAQSISARVAINLVANLDSAKPPIAARAPRPSGVEQMNWQSLQQAVASCGACALCESRKNMVFGVGQLPADEAQAPQVDWLIVGEAPGENEDAQGEPFVGQAGKLLDNMLAAMKIGKDGKALSRTEGVYIANVLKCRPPANRNPSAEEVAMCEPYLARQIELLRPKIILAMGKFAIQALTGSNDPVGKLRGRVHKLKHATYQAPVIVTYHPAYLLRNLPDKAKAWADLLLAMQTFSDLPHSAN
jgi:uracil-DNA glycosylase